MTNVLHLDFIERDQKGNSINLSGVEKKDGEKTTKVALEILKKVDPTIKKMYLITDWKLKKITIRKVLMS